MLLSEIKHKNEIWKTKFETCSAGRKEERYGKYEREVLKSAGGKKGAFTWTTAF